MATTDSVTRMGSNQADPPHEAAAGSGLDPIQAQNLACASIFKLLEDRQPSLGQFAALLDLDRHAKPVSDQLLNRYVEGDSPLRRFQRSYWISALHLSQSFFEAYNHFLRHLLNGAEADLQAQAPVVVVQLLRHRQIEFLLRLIRFKKRIAGQWKEVHQIYQFARTRGIALERVDTKQADDTLAPATTPEQQYLRVLLLEVMNNGQFSPREALWADAWFNGWRDGLHLQARESVGGIDGEHNTFAVDLDGTDGLRWPAIAVAGSPLFFDPTPLLTLIDEERHSLRGSAAPRGALAPAGRAGRIALLAKVRALFDPSSPRAARHDERIPVDLAVQTVFSASNIVNVLHHEAMGRAKDEPASDSLDGITISRLGAEPYRALFPDGGDTNPTTAAIIHDVSAAPQVWQLRDRSDSGSRLRGQIDDLNRIIPGSLIAFRESADAPWTVSVVRRFRRLMVDHVEIGVEHIGRGPRFVKLVAESAGNGSPDATGDAAQRCFAALYLPPSERQPTMPIKTLLLPECNFTVDSTVTLLSSDATYTLRLSEPIQQQFEFIWTSFIVVDKAHVSGTTEEAAG